MNKPSKALFLFYILLAYVIVQFAWWAWLIYDLNAEIITLTADGAEHDGDHQIRRKMLMILGEGTVFLSLLFLGGFYIRRFLNREFKLARQERNFLMATTHELNSPLAAIKLNLQTLKRTGLSDQQRNQVIAGANEATERLQRLVSNLLMTSKLDSDTFSLHLQPVDLKDLMEHSIRIIHPLAEEKEIGIESQMQSAEAHADPEAMKSVFSNLLSNAVKYSPVGSRIEVTLSLQNENAVVCISDEGIGIATQDRALVTRKFFRSEDEETRSQKGTGLGLYIANELVRKTGGQLRISSNHPVGTTITVEIPLKS